MILAIDYFFDYLNKWKNKSDLKNQNKFEFLLLNKLLNNNITFKNEKNYKVLARYLISGKKVSNKIYYTKTDNWQINLILNKLNKNNLVEIDLTSNIVNLIETIYQGKTLILPKSRLTEMLTYYTSGNIILFEDMKYGKIEKENDFTYIKNFNLDPLFYQKMYNLKSYGYNDLMKNFRNIGLKNNHLISRNMFYLEYNKFDSISDNLILDVWNLLEKDYWMNQSIESIIKIYFDKIYLMEGQNFVKTKNYLYKNKLFYSQINNFNKILEDAVNYNLDNIVIYFNNFNIPKNIFIDNLVINKSKNTVNQIFLKKELIRKLYWKKINNNILDSIIK
tara:strand:+ start:351 stop:1352 length:1002 start_codon:yes stop_codon:yes gene_type:complete